MNTQSADEKIEFKKHIKKDVSIFSDSSSDDDFKSQENSKLNCNFVFI
jgi:hypothetical protein